MASLQSIFSGFVARFSRGQDKVFSAADGEAAFSSGAANSRSSFGLDVASIANGAAKQTSEYTERKKPQIAPVLRPGGRKSPLADGCILLSGNEIVDLEAAERFRILRSRIERRAITLGSRQQVIGVTSAVPGEGKSVVAVNLARAFGTDPQGKTIIVDCDLRKPTLHRFFSEAQGPGLSDVLCAGKSPGSVIRTVEPGLDILPAGSPVIDATRAVEQPSLHSLLEELKRRYRYVIFDCPPVLLCSEPLILAQHVSSILIVARSWKTEKNLVKDAVQMIGQKLILGIVLNECNDSLQQYGYYGYYGYSRESINAAKAKDDKKRKELKEANG